MSAQVQAAEAQALSAWRRASQREWLPYRLRDLKPVNCILPTPHRFNARLAVGRMSVTAACVLATLLASQRLSADTALRANAGTSHISGIAPKTSRECIPGGGGYLRVKIRGALRLDVDLHNSELECEGGARPDGSGIRVSFAGPLRSDGRRLRMVFGISGAAEGSAVRERPTNLTVIFEGEQRIFGTRGDDKCTTEDLRQERTGALAGAARSYRVIARGFCIAPVNALPNNTETILVTSFDFAGSITYEDPAR